MRKFVALSSFLFQLLILLSFVASGLIDASPAGAQRRRNAQSSDRELAEVARAGSGRDGAPSGRRSEPLATRAGSPQPAQAAAPAAGAVLVDVASSGTLEGEVRAADGTPLPHFVLLLEGPITFSPQGVRIAPAERTLLTGPAGRYAAAGLEPGTYRIAARSRTVALDAEDAAGAQAAGDAERSGSGFAAERSSEVRSQGGRPVGRADLMVAPRPIEERIVVTATRGEALATTSGVSTAVIDEQTLADRSASTLLDLVGGQPGLTTARTGGVGSQGSIFVRGGESDFVRVLVDGVPINEPGGAYDFGSTLPLELERVELVRGAASALYGTDALAGVLHLVTRRGEGRPAVRLEGEAGSEDWERGLAGLSGATRGAEWSLGAQSLDTTNETPNSAFESTTGALSAGIELGPAARLRLTGRASDSRIGTPGPVRFGRPDLDAFFDRQDVAAGAVAAVVRGAAEHELRVGWSESDQLSVNPLDSGSYVPLFGDRVSPFTFFDVPNAEGFQNDTDRLTAGYRAEVAAAAARHLLTGGVDFERETGSLGDRRFDLLEPERENWGVYLQDRALLGERVFVVASGRVEDNASFGSRFTPRLALAWESRTGARVLRASAGAGIKEPSLPESFGVSFFARGNPDLRSEESRTWDVGIAQLFGEGAVRLDAALFLHEYENQVAFEVIDFATFEGTFVNLGETRGRGLELSVEANPVRALRVTAHYTWLDGEVLVSGNAFSPVFAAGRSLLRRPEHEASLLIVGDAGRFRPGLRLLAVGERADSDFSGLDLEESPGYLRLDLRLRVELARRLDLVLAADNALDRDYDEAMGFPALGRSVRAGVAARLGGR